MKKAWRAALAGLLGMVMTLGALSAASAAAVPKDIQGHWAQAQIQNWLNQGYLSGYPDGTFRPNQSVSRAEYVAMINRLLGFKETGTVTFSDVKTSSWAYSEVAKAVKAGYIGGYENNTFRPNNPISRQEAAVIAAKVLRLNTGGTATSFKDAALISSWARGAVAAAAQLKVIGGYPDGTFGPKKALTRAEAVGIVGNSAAHYAGGGSGTAPTPTPTPSPTAGPSASPTPSASAGTGGGGGGTGGGSGGGTIVYPTVSNATYGVVGSVTADVHLTASVTGSVYYAVTTNVNAAPTSLEVQQGTAGPGNTVVQQGFVPVTASGATVGFSVYGLTPDTEYAAYLTLSDNSGLLSVQPVKVTFRTAAATVTNGTVTSITYLAPGPIVDNRVGLFYRYGDTNAPLGRAALVVLPAGDPAPTAQQVWDGQNASGVPVPAGYYDTGTATGGVTRGGSLPAFMPNTEYIVYMVSRDAALTAPLSPIEVLRFRTP